MRPTAWSPTKAMTIDIGGWLRFASRELEDFDRPGLEAQLLLASVLKKSRGHILAHLDELISAAQLLQLNRLLGRLKVGEPLAYLSGTREFYGLEFIVTPDVLVPRPETELLVETALSWLTDHPRQRFAADVGSGSGCIAAVLTSRIPDLRILAADRSWQALQIAGQNFTRLGLDDRIGRLQADLLTSVGGRFDLVCANLPYIPTDTLNELSVSRYEPRLALDGGPDGLLYIRRLLADAHRWLAAGGLLLLEIEARHGDQVSGLAGELLPGSTVTVKTDLAGLPRLVYVERGLD